MAGKNISVDEERLQKIMAGEYDPGLDTGKSDPKDGKGNGVAPPTKNVKKKKGGDGDYAEVYLRKRLISNRKQTSLSLDGELISKISQLLNSAGTGITVSGFINNLLSLHVENHKEVINEIYESKQNKLF